MTLRSAKKCMVEEKISRNVSRLVVNQFRIDFGRFHACIVAMRAKCLLNAFCLIIRRTLACLALCGKGTQLVVTPFHNLSLRIVASSGAPASNPIASGNHGSCAA